ncbi:MAG: hypothetical protein HOV81_04695 [Kofleriaceae bacterium]|nr:hypothetical protein [Kofleriaceae bacterium]
MKTLGLFMTMVLGACTLPAMMRGAPPPTARETTTSSSSHTEEINGQPLDSDEPPPEFQPASAKKSKKKDRAEDFGATCRNNSECSSKTCFVGSGELGYCTQMCSSWTECPTHWECQRAANAPQKICMQDS